MGKYVHPTKLTPIEEYTCMECGSPVGFQFGVCGNCVAVISRRKAEEQVADAKAEREREQWIEERRARRGK